MLYEVMAIGRVNWCSGPPQCGATVSPRATAHGWPSHARSHAITHVATGQCGYW